MPTRFKRAQSVDVGIVAYSKQCALFIIGSNWLIGLWQRTSDRTAKLDTRSIAAAMVAVQPPPEMPTIDTSSKSLAKRLIIAMVGRTNGTSEV